MVSHRLRVVPLVGLLTLVILITPVPVHSGKPNPCPQVRGLDNLLSFILPSASACPPTFWAKTYGAGGALFARPTSDGGFITAGIVNGGSPCCNEDFKILRLDGDGNIIWQKT